MNLLLPEIDWAALKDLALFSLAIYAALLSTINWRRAQNNDQIEEFAESKIIVSAGSIIVFRGPAYAQVTAVNAGNDPVTVMLLTFEAPGGTRLQLFEQDGVPEKPDTKLPATLNEGQSAKMTVSYRDIAQALHNNDQVGVVTLTPICVDTAGAVYRGELWEVNITTVRSDVMTGVLGARRPARLRREQLSSVHGRLGNIASQQGKCNLLKWTDFNGRSRSP